MSDPAMQQAGLVAELQGGLAEQYEAAVIRLQGCHEHCQYTQEPGVSRTAECKLQGCC